MPHGVRARQGPTAPRVLSAKCSLLAHRPIPCPRVPSRVLAVLPAGRALTSTRGDAIVRPNPRGSARASWYGRAVPTLLRWRRDGRVSRARSGDLAATRGAYLGAR